jgi:hypothetical protein
VHKFSKLLNIRYVIEEPLQFRRRTGSNVSTWIASNARPIGFRDLAKERKRAVPLDAWHRQLGILTLYEQYLTTHSAKLGGDLVAALGALQHERQSIEQRIALVQLPFPSRMPAAWRMWGAGGYRHFEGLLSALNDVLRRG